MKSTAYRFLFEAEITENRGRAWSFPYLDYTTGRRINPRFEMLSLLLQMRPGRLDPRLVDALQVSHNGSGILGVIFL
jgi:hypothetical protein